MIFKNLARQNEIGANCYLVDTGSCRIILDSGLHPKEEGRDAIPHHNAVDYDSVDAIILTHAHLDHAGTIPVIMRNQPSAELFLTPPTAALTEAMLHNSVNVMQSKREELGIEEYPLFSHDEIDEIKERWRHIDYLKKIEITEGVFITFYNAGHILGSCGVLIETADHRLFYTGDIQFADQNLIKGAEFPTENIDTLVIETTRGAAPRTPDYNREEEKDKLCKAIVASLKRGGSALIPVFAMGKTQEVLSMINEFKKDGRIYPQTPVFIGGLSTKMTLIFDDFADSEYRSDEDFNIIEDMNIRTGSKKKRRQPIVYRKRAIYALSSGMMTEKTVSNQFARTFINNPKNALLFVGYADPDSPAGKLRASKRGDMICLDPAQEKVKFDCPMRVYDFSGHSTRDEILDYILQVKPKKTFLVHGDLEASEWFQEQLQDQQPESETLIPQPLTDYQLTDNA